MGTINSATMAALRPLVKPFAESRLAELTFALAIGLALYFFVGGLTSGLILPVASVLLDFDPDATIELGSDFQFMGRGQTILLGGILYHGVALLLTLGLVSLFLPRIWAGDEAAKLECPYCLSLVPFEATKCAFCASELPDPEYEDISEDEEPS